MKTLYALLIFVSTSLLFAGEVKVGQSEGELLSNQPTPEGVITVGKKTLYHWPDIEVKVVNGIVTSVEPRWKPRELSSHEIEAARLETEKIQAAQKEKYKRYKADVEERQLYYAAKRELEKAVDEALKPEVSRWQKLEGDVRRQTTTRNFEKWQTLRDNYLNAFREELLALYAGNEEEAAYKGEVKSRLESILKQRTKRYANNVVDNN